ncbi:hypothetical protein A2118_00125 [Candidatus Kaiserbacteria bacterium GWA2_50_9]|uniref:HTH cro/C1-type domain-containing protein n=1 Tax=Candidatus Kaiserbacteria bacterium GWA2_50_9 TaxID=1798474 RepID=A0A1F6BSH8_9BACT|nr:MAG: hypothetical protein A2118_00125 [Candidatus Kaiserbacteria bacterium GWA2_50_9]
MTTPLLKKLREEQGLSQAIVAKELKMSRPTYISLEQGKRKLTLSEAECLAQMFDISLDELVYGKRRKVDVVLSKTPVSKKADVEGGLRINVPAENKEKFKQVLLYILEKIGSKPNIGMTALYKILYFIDFDYYEKFEEQLMGAVYIRNHYGPTPVAFAKIVKEMEREGTLETVETKYFQHEQKKFLPRTKSELKQLSGQEIAHIDETLARLGDKNARELTELSHRDIPWMCVKDGEQLEYESVFYRSDETSQRDYGPDPL